MQSVRVALGARSYPIHIGSGLLERPELIAPVMPQRRAAIVTNETVAPLYLGRLGAALARAGIETVPVVIPDGEQYKDWRTLNTVYDALLAARCDRATTIVALGGGVVGDLAGFAAATYQRGVPYVQVPTTLLAQVDSSVGGKTAVNHPRGKNILGAFYQPLAVIADIDTLKTLPERELRAGMAEVVKHGVICDAGFFAWLERDLDRLLARDPQALGKAVLRSCEIKAGFVSRDERESGERALLNFGHTFGHAIEAGLGYGKWLHGEAVAAGMVLAAELSRRLGYLSENDVARIAALLERAGLPVSVRGLSAERFLELMSVDKKARDQRLTFIVLEKIGKALIRGDVPRELLRDTLAVAA